MENIEQARPSLDLHSRGDAKRIRCLTNIREVIRSYIEAKHRKNEILDQDDVNTFLLGGEFCSNLFQLFDHKGSGYLIQDDWMAEIQKRSYSLKGGYSASIKSMVEMLETVTYLVCQDSFVYEENFAKIMGVKNLSEKIMQVAGKAGKMSVEDLMGFIMVITSPQQDDGLNPEGVKRLEKVFRDIVGDEGQFTLTQFKQIVSSKNDFFVERTFKIFDKDGSGTVSLVEFIEGMNEYAAQTNEKKISFLFKIYDINNNGFIDKDEMIEMMKACMKESGLVFDQNVINDLGEAFYEDAVPEGAMGITADDLLNQLQKHEGLLENMTICIGRWLVPIKSSRKRKQKIPKKLTWNHWKEKKPLFFWMLGIAVLNISFMIERFYYFRDVKMLDGTPNYFYILSRCFGKLALVNSMLVVTFVLRYSLTVLRNMGLGVYIPIDHNIFIHKVLGWFLFLCALIHTVMHFCNFAINVQPNPVRYVQINADYHDHVNGGNEMDVSSVQEFLTRLGYKPPDGCMIIDLVGNYTDPCPIMPISNHTLKLRENNSCPHEDQVDPLYVCQSCGNGSHPWTYFDWILTSRPHMFGMVPGWANPSGVGLIIVFTIMTLLSLPFVRRRGNFQVFYVSHLLYGVYFILFMLHAPTVWPFVAPVGLLILELLYRNLNSLMGHGKTKVNAGVLHHSKVTQLIIKRPPGFNFSPGDWVFIKIPKVAIMEWHAFTISSAPEVSGTFTLHIRGVGGWTNRLYEYFEQEYKTQHMGEADSAARKPIAMLKRSFSKVVSGDCVTTSPESLEKKYDLYNTIQPAAQENSQAKFQRYLSEPISNENYSKKLKRIKSERYTRAKPTIVKFDATILEDPTEEVEENKFINQNKDVTIQNIEMGRKTNLTKSLEIFVDGPFGSPSSDIYRAEHAVLIATGIGVTPYASILQSLMNKYRQSKSHCPKCDYQWADETYEEFAMFNLKKVDFFWMNRDQKSIEWFTKLLSELEIEQAEHYGVMERLLDMHIYVTSALQKTDMKAVGLQLAMDLLHKKENRDSVTGLKARTKAGRPNWDKVFRKIQDERKGKVSIFYCGNPILAKELNQKCVEFGFQFKKETF